MSGARKTAQDRRVTAARPDRQFKNKIDRNI